MQDIGSDTVYDTRQRSPEGTLALMSQNDRLRHRLIGSARVLKADGSQSLALPCDALQAPAPRDLCVSNSQFSR